MILIKTTKQIHQEAFANVFNYFNNMENGDVLEFRGGLGNKVIRQTMKKDDKYYERNNIDEEWTEFNFAERVLNILKKIRT